MKVCKLKLKNFKKFEDLELDFTDEEGEPKSLLLLHGGNGSGKTTVLQAVAAMLGKATGILPAVDALHWPGFDLKQAAEAWAGPPSIELEVALNSDEIETTRFLWDQLKEYQDDLKARPSERKRIWLRLRGNRAEASTSNELFQLHGRHYARNLLRFRKDIGRPFEKVGGSFWYDVHRGPASLMQIADNPQSTLLNETNLRKKLVEWLTYHQQFNGQKGSSQRDFFVELQEGYRLIFPNRRFVGLGYSGSPGEALEEPLFYLHDGRNRYEVSEMSGGERAVIPILLDFINWQINQSVVLIDELELHLHPPQQQALLRALKHLGRNNQYIITTHSQHIYKLFAPEDIIRLGAMP